MYRLIYTTLLESTLWDNRNVVVFFDVAFTSAKLLRDLYNKRGIHAVSPVNASKPDKGGGPNSWPHQTFKSSHTKFLNRGWDRVALSPLDGNGWMQVCC